MLTGAGGSSGPSLACGLNVTQLHVQLLTGEEFTLSLLTTMLGREVRQLVSKQGERRKFQLALLRRASALLPHQTLQQQGILGQEAAVNCIFVPVDLYAAWRCAGGKYRL